MYDKYELAWAAGLFDGEGSVGHYKYATQLMISQVDRRVLDRFLAAVKLGKIHGPYMPKGKQQKPVFRYGVHNFEHVQQIAACLWAYLSPVKKEQFRRALCS
jgi:hypothetical protein